VFEVYDALLRSPNWNDTLLVITYDEHGGFYDHVPPPELPTTDEARPEFTTYGVRVPALIVGPRVRREVLHAPAPADADGAQYDHATLIKTILQAFARNPTTAIARMPGRVQRAPDLADVLLDEPRTDVDDPRNARDLMDTWRQEARRRRMALPADQVEGEATASVAPDGAGHPLILTDFQSDWQKFATTMRTLGVEP
jgi:phospholipase C